MRPSSKFYLAFCLIAVGVIVGMSVHAGFADGNWGPLVALSIVPPAVLAVLAIDSALRRADDKWEQRQSHDHR